MNCSAAVDAVSLQYPQSITLESEWICSNMGLMPCGETHRIQRRTGCLIDTAAQQARPRGWPVERYNPLSRPRVTRHEADFRNHRLAAFSPNLDIDVVLVS